jgi:ATP-dependent DNA helicase RecQ
MARRLPRTRSEMLAISGVGQVKYERYGEAFLAVTRAAAPPPPAGAPAPPPRTETPLRLRDGRVVNSSLRRTWELFRAGLTVEQIAGQRGLAPSTIVQHISELVAAGEIEDIAQWVDDLTLARIRKAANGAMIGPLAPLREALGDAVSYEQLHLARAYLNRERDLALRA